MADATIVEAGRARLAQGILADAAVNRDANERRTRELDDLTATVAARLAEVETRERNVKLREDAAFTAEEANAARKVELDALAKELKEKEGKITQDRMRANGETAALRRQTKLLNDAAQKDRETAGQVLADAEARMARIRAFAAEMGQ